LFAFSFGHFYGIFYEVFVFVDGLPNYEASFPAASNSLFLQSLSRDTNVMLLILRPFYKFFRHANVMLNTIRIRMKKKRKKQTKNKTKTKKNKTKNNKIQTKTLQQNTQKKTKRIKLIEN
jgi:hypothetical protein